MIAVGPYTLRADQERAVAELRAAIAGLLAEGKPPRVLLQGPTGFGKTVVSSALIRLMLDKGKTCAFLAHGRQLIFQKSAKLTECEIEHAVLMAGVGDDQLDGRYARPLRGSLGNQRVVVASKDTYVARAYARGSVERFSVDAVIVDEADEAMSDDWLRILSENPAVVVIGLTATPVLGNGKGLGGFYNALVRSAGYAELIDIGALVRCRVFAPYSVDMTGVKAGANGEYSQPEAAKRFHTDALVGDVVENWKRYAEGRPTAVFAQSVAHSVALAAQFNKAGIPAAHIDADSPQDERDDVFSGITSGRLTVVCNYAVVRRGVDLPVLGCGQLACAMRSLRAYIQTVGRIVRSCRNPYWCDGPKPDAVLIDHGGNVYRHQWPTLDREWSLDPGKVSGEPAPEKDERQPPAKELTCFACGFMFPPKLGPACPNCGARKAKRGQKVRTAQGELREVTEKAAKAERDNDDQALWKRLLGVGANTDMTVKRVRAIFFRTRGYWPPEHLEPMPARHESERKVAALYPGFRRRKASA